MPFPESKCGFLGVDCHVAAVVYSDGKMGLACGGSGGGYLWQDRGWLVGVVEVATCGKIGVGWGVVEVAICGKIGVGLRGSGGGYLWQDRGWLAG